MTRLWPGPGAVVHGPANVSRFPGAASPAFHGPDDVGKDLFDLKQRTVARQSRWARQSIVALMTKQGQSEVALVGFDQPQFLQALQVLRRQLMRRG